MERTPPLLTPAAAHAAHRFEDFSKDFAAWVIFYGVQKQQPTHG